MPRSRPYTRRELETLRRADLQNLYKIHGLKGANNKTDALIDSLESFFASSSFKAGSPKPQRPRQLKSLPEPEKAARPVARRSPLKAAARPRDLSGRSATAVDEVVPPDIAKGKFSEPVKEVNPVKLLQRVDTLVSDVNSLDARLSSEKLETIHSEIASIRSAVSQLESDVKGLERSFTEQIERSDTVWKERADEMERRWRDRLEEMQRGWEARVEKIMRPALAEAQPTEPSSLGKRRDRESSPQPSPANAAIQSESRELSLPRGPPSPSKSPAVFRTPEVPHARAIPPPRTPSPGHQGSLPDNSATPAFGPDYFSGLPPGQSHSEVLPFPLFATTPRPAAPVSPTTDAPPSTKRARTASAPSLLTPGRRPSRTVSHAHIELSTVTEAAESTPPRISLPAESAQIPLFGPTLPPTDVETPPRLSPSPSIHGDRLQRVASPANPNSAQQSSMARSASPAQDFMDIAMHKSPGIAIATPRHRTMLGTERYRDTRFGDLPVMQWGTPTADFSTPRRS